MKIIKIFLMLTFLSLFGCEEFGGTADIGEPFTLKTKESATIGGTGIQIILDRIGRRWGTKSSDGETLDLSFSVKYNGKTEIYSEDSSAPITAGKYTIEVVKTEPFGEGYVVFQVNKTVKTSTDEAAAQFVEKFGWHIDESIAPTKTPCEVPDNFDGLQFNRYQSAPQRSGVDMTPLIGQNG